MIVRIACSVLLIIAAALCVFAGVKAACSPQGDTYGVFRKSLYGLGASLAMLALVWVL